jgi:hypothetical protein
MGKLSAQLAAQALKARSRKTITLPNAGVEVEISKLDQLEYVRLGGGIIAAVEAEQAGNPVREEDKAAFVKRLLKLCVVTPPVYTGDGKCPDDHVTIADLADDLQFLITEVMAFNSLRKEDAAAAASFREDAGGPA